MLGLFYLFGLVSPLILSALGIGRLRHRLRDPAISLRFAGRQVRSTVSRLVGGLSFLVLGSLMMVLALTGNARSAPGAQKALGTWLRARGNEIGTAVPSAVGWALMVALATLVVYFGIRAIRRPPRLAPAVGPDVIPAWRRSRGQSNDADIKE
jgi:hypothetical protein